MIINSKLIITFVVAALTTGCCNEPKSIQNINVHPLLKLDMIGEMKTIKNQFSEYDVVVSEGININSHDLNNDMFEMIRNKYSFNKENEVVVTIIIFKNNSKSVNYYDFIINNRWHMPDKAMFTINGINNNRCCISYIKEELADKSGLCRRLGIYDSFVIFQKNNLVVDILEKNNSTSIYKEKIVSDVAKRLSLLSKVSSH